MSLLYVKTNLINSNTLPDNTYVSTEDSVYTVDNLYNKRPSKPFRFTATTAQWIKVQLAISQPVNFAAVFNHNFNPGVTLSLQGANADAGYSTIVIPSWRKENFYSAFQVTWKWFKFNVTDGGNPRFPQVGEFFLGNYARFLNAYLQPGQSDGPTIYMSDQKTHYGQDWSTYNSQTRSFSIGFENITKPAVIDDIQTFLEDVFENNNGKFILIPDENQPHCYYVRITNRNNFSNLLVNGVNQLRGWRLELETLTKGIALL